MNSVAPVYLSDEEAAVEAANLSEPQLIDLGSSVIHIGRKGVDGKMIVMASSGKCVMLDYPFAGNLTLL